MSEKPSDDAEIEKLKRAIANARREQGLSEVADPKPLSSTRPLVEISEEEQDRRRLADEARKKELREIQIGNRWNAFIAQCGRRYEGCSLDNYQAETDSQREALAELRDYCGNLRERVKAGVNLILFGPKGTGKDHLLVSLAHEAILQGADVAWWNGVDLFGEVRDRIARNQNEREFIERLASPHVLYISDPLPPVGVLTEFQIQTLFRVLDSRYRQMRPVWCSVNVAGPEEAEARLGPQNADRLRDGALALYCNWPSYRKVRT